MERLARIESYMLDSALESHTSATLSRHFPKCGAELFTRLLLLFHVALKRKSPGQHALGLRLSGGNRFQLHLFVIIEALFALGVFMKRQGALSHRSSRIIDALQVLTFVLTLLSSNRASLGELFTSIRVERTVGLPARQGALASVYSHTALRALSDAANALRSSVEWGVLSSLAAHALAVTAAHLSDRWQPHARNNSRVARTGIGPAMSSSQLSTGPSSCAFCHLDPPCMPHCAPCSHVFCYYCAAAIVVDGASKCPSCETHIELFYATSRQG